MNASCTISSAIATEPTDRYAIRTIGARRSAYTDSNDLAGPGAGTWDASSLTTVLTGERYRAFPAPPATATRSSVRGSRSSRALSDGSDEGRNSQGRETLQDHTELAQQPPAVGASGAGRAEDSPGQRHRDQPRHNRTSSPDERAHPFPVEVGGRDRRSSKHQPTGPVETRLERPRGRPSGGHQRQPCRSAQDRGSRPRSTHREGRGGSSSRVETHGLCPDGTVTPSRLSRPASGSHPIWTFGPGGARGTRRPSGEARGTSGTGGGMHGDGREAAEEDRALGSTRHRVGSRRRLGRVRHCRRGHELRRRR